MASCLDEKTEMPALLTPDTKSSRMRTSKTLFAIFTLLFLAAAAFYFYRKGIPFYQTSTLFPSWNDDFGWPIPRIPSPELPAPVEPFEPLKRYSLHYGKVACWQDGGVWIKEVKPVEMSFLAIDRFQDPARALEQADEDTFCTRRKFLAAAATMARASQLVRGCR